MSESDHREPRDLPCSRPGLRSCPPRTSRVEAMRHYICLRSFQFIQNPRIGRTFLLSSVLLTTVNFCELKTDKRPAAKHSQSTPSIMCPQLQESTPCTIASSAAPDGMSAKSDTACGDSPAGPAPTTRNRSRPCSAPSISVAISLTPPGPTAPAAASRSSEEFCEPTKIIP